MKKQAIRFVQARLNAGGLNAGPEDGLLGPRTLQALDRVEGVPHDWAKTRKAVAFIQILAKEHGIEAGKTDGYWGPQTDYAFQEIQRLRLDLWGGCLNVRTMRGGTRYSLHSWGIAVDYDPERNRLKWGRDRAAFAQPEYDPWWRLWEEEGWVSLGRHRNFDWMHIQAAFMPMPADTGGKDKI